MEKKQAYPKTPHLPWSGTIGADDIILEHTNDFQDKRITVTEKLDGENITIRRDAFYLKDRALSQELDGPLLSVAQGLMESMHPSYVFYGEYMMYRYNIPYRFLPSVLIIHSVAQNGVVLTYREMQPVLREYGLQPVPLLYSGVYDDGVLKRIAAQCDGNPQCEGYVVRLDERYPFTQFQRYNAKYVKPDFAQVHAGQVDYGRRNGFA